MPYYTAIGSIHALYPAINTAQNTGLTSAVVLGFIDQVEAEVNAKVSKKYTLPFTNGCPILAAIATREAIFRIAIERGLVHFPPAAQGRAPLAVQHDMDQKLLDQIADGKYNLLDNSLSVIATDLTQAEVYSTTMNYIPTFHEGGLLDQVQDTDKLEAEVDRREGRGL